MSALHDAIRARLNGTAPTGWPWRSELREALRAVVVLHDDTNGMCNACGHETPCATIDAVAAELEATDQPGQEARS